VNVLVDTSVWSLALRRQENHLAPAEKRVRLELTELIHEGRARLIGPIRQELLTGLRNEKEFERVREGLSTFDDEELKTLDFEDAARISNACRSRDIAGCPVDFLLCAAAMRQGWPIFTTDADFARYARVVPIRLHHPRPTA
jgi:hypothetical protein